MNRLADAQAELEQAIALSPDTSALHYKLGQILRKEGQDAERAQQEFAICERLNGASFLSIEVRLHSGRSPE